MTDTESREEKIDQALDLLLDALGERQAARRRAAGSKEGARSESSRAPAATRPGEELSSPGRSRSQTAAMAKTASRDPQPGDPGWELPERNASIQLDKTLWRLILLVAALALVMNIPVTSYGVSLARIMPDTASLIVRDGLVLKGDGAEIYMLEDDKLRWISSLDAFDHLGLRWEDVHEVDDAFLADFEKGEPLHVLLKCSGSPHIYRIENERKRWIKDIPTFEAEGHIWEDVRMVSCAYLRGIPDGPTIPEGAGQPPIP